MKNKTSQNISILNFFPIFAWKKFCLAFYISTHLFFLFFLFLEKEILVALLFMNKKARQNKRQNIQWNRLQSPTRFVMEKKLLLSRLKYVQLHCLTNLHERKKYSKKSLHGTKCLWTDSAYPWFVKMIQKIISQLILILGFSWPYACMISWLVLISYKIKIQVMSNFFF